MTARRLDAAALAASALLIAACSGARQPHACTTDSDCAPSSHCGSGACIANAPPVAAIDAPAPEQRVGWRVLTFDGSRSHDPDVAWGDQIASYAWTGRSAGASCEPIALDASGATYRAFFGCAGDFEVSLTVTDASGAASERAVTQITLAAPSLPPPVVATGDPIGIDHGCSGNPLVCIAANGGAAPGFTLHAGGVDTGGAQLTQFEWRFAIPPELYGKPAPRVRFDPSPKAADPRVTIETDGTAISGEYVFTAFGTDRFGTTNIAFQRVTVGNRNPVLVGGGPLPVDHAYASSLYVASGSVKGTFADPDGDPVESATLALVETSPTECAFSLTDPTVSGAPDLSGSFSMSCADPQQLVLLRFLRLTASDVNAGSAWISWDLRVTNRPPTVTIDGGPTHSSDHTVEPCGFNPEGRCFVVRDTPVITIADPDGDPVVRTWAEPQVDPGLPHSHVRNDATPGSFAFETLVQFPPEFRSEEGRTGFTINFGAADPFEATNVSYALRALDHPPVLVSAAPPATVTHSYDAAQKAYQATASLSWYEDPDGDPLSVTSTDPVCNAFTLVPGSGSAQQVVAHCQLPYDIAGGGAPPLASLAGTRALALLVSDPWQGLAQTATLTVADAPAVVDPANVTQQLSGCSCKCNQIAGTCYWRYELGPAPFSPPVSDGDGDPVRLDWLSGGCGVVTPLTQACSPGACQVVVDATACAGNSFAPLLVVSDGYQSNSAMLTLTVTCPTAGQGCLPYAY